MPADIRDTSTWQWNELSNGGAYMTPGLAFGRVDFKTRDYTGNVSVEAAAIIACLHTYILLAYRANGSDFDWYHSPNYMWHYRLLRRFALRHLEAVEILEASEW